MTRKSSFLFLAVAVAPLLLTLQAPERAEFLHQVSLTFTRPLALAGHTISNSIQEAGTAVARFRGLYQRQVFLEEEVSRLRYELIQQTELQKENERLHALLAFKKEIPRRTIPARVVGRDLALWRRTILIDKGARDGIQNQMAVVNAEGLVGRIVEVGRTSSRAILLLDPESRVSVVFQESRDLGVAEGDGSSWLKVTRISREAAVKVGDFAVSSGLGEVYPKGIPVGRVEIVGNEKEGPELFASVRPQVDFSKLEEVLCIVSLPAAT